MHGVLHFTSTATVRCVPAVSSRILNSTGDVSFSRWRRPDGRHQTIVLSPGLYEENGREPTLEKTPESRRRTLPPPDPLPWTPCPECPPWTPPPPDLPKFRACVSPSGGPFVECWWCLKRWDPLMCTFGLSGCLVKPRRPVQGGPISAFMDLATTSRSYLASDTVLISWRPGNAKNARNDLHQQ